MYGEEEDDVEQGGNNGCFMLDNFMPGLKPDNGSRPFASVSPSTGLAAYVVTSMLHRVLQVSRGSRLSGRTTVDQQVALRLHHNYFRSQLPPMTLEEEVSRNAVQRVEPRSVHKKLFQV